MRLVLAVAALAFLSPTARAGEAAPAPSKPGPGADPAAAAALRKLFERELEPLKEIAFRTPKGFRGKVEAKTAPEVRSTDEGELLSISLGTEQPVTCTILPERIDAGGTTLQLLGRVAKSLEIVQARPSDVRAVGASAILFAEVIYRMKSEKGPLVGAFEIAVQPHETHSLICVHDEPGYAETFRRVVTGLAGSLASDEKDPRATSRFAEIVALRIGPMPIGFSERVIWPRPDGGRTTRTWGAQILPRTPSELAVADTFEQEDSDAQGLLIEATHVHVENGEVESRFHLTRGEDGKTYRYSGEKSGKKLEGTFPSKAGLATELWFARRFDAKSGYGPKAEVRHEAWSSSSNPVAATPVAYRREGPGARRAHMSMGSLSVSGELDENGLFGKAEMPVGPAVLASDRLWTRGAP
jgi:hypothetical protein